MKKGFTLIEMLVVIGVLSILLAGVLVAVNPFEQIKKGRDSKRMQDLKSVQSALELFYDDYGYYPLANSSQIDDGGARAWGTSWTPYIQVLPKDPVNGKNYGYKVSGDGQQYWIYATLERPEKTCSQSLTTVCTNAQSGVSCTGGICNFGVSSGNTSP